MAQLSESKRRLLEESVRRDLPGWRLSTSVSAHKKPAASATDGLSVKRVGDLEQLRKKFLGSDSDASSSSAAAVDRVKPAVANVSTVVVESLDGRRKKVADVVNGHVTIVQG